MSDSTGVTTDPSQNTLDGLTVRPPGTRVGDFVIDALIGSGGMGQVYRAHQDGVDRPVALKIVRPALAADPEFVGRFRREASMMRDLEHPSILTVYAAGEDAGTLHLATRLVAGPTLQQVLSEGRPAHARTLEILRAVATGIDHAHSRGVIHRDIKPANILLDLDGRPFLADFGISKQLGGDGGTAVGHYLGTPRYMAPEQAGSGGAVGHPADLYALGCVAFEMLTGDAPYVEEDTVPLLMAHATKPIPLASAAAPELPTAVDDVFVRALAKEPGQRYPSAASFVEALAAALERPAAAPPRRRGRGWLIGAGAVAVVTAVALVAWMAWPVPPSPVPPVPGPTATVRPSTASTAFTPSAPLLSGVARGALLYQAAMNGTPGGFVDAPRTQADSAREEIRYVPGALELEAVAAGADTYSELDVTEGITTYVGEMDLAVRPGTDLDLCWSLRWAVPRQLANYWCLNTGQQTAEFSVYRRGDGRVPIGTPAPVADLQSGRTVHVALVVRPRQLSMYVEGALVADVPNEQVPVAGTIPGIELESDEGTGLVRIQGLRIYDLAP
jgi:hypothetical protein